MPQLHENLARLVAENLGVRRWLFKIDEEMDGRGIGIVSHFIINFMTYNEVLHLENRICSFANEMVSNLCNMGINGSILLR